jgi:diacylglycerol kinase (ATP)
MAVPCSWDSGLAAPECSDFRFLLLSSAHMRAAAILGLGCSPKNLDPFQAAATPQAIEWRVGVPSAADRADVILLFGGDGTIHRHLNQLVKLRLPVLVVPVGSGNDFARALGLRSARDSCAAWQRFRIDQSNVRAIDLGVVIPLANSSSSHVSEIAGRAGPGTRYFCGVAGVGLDCEVARRANMLPRFLRGHGGYALSLVSTMFRFAPFPMKILTHDEKDWIARSDQPTLLAALANSPVYGDGMNIAPKAQIDDGQIDICVIAGIDPFKLACMFPTVYFGRHLRIRGVEYFRAARARVETGHPLDVYADGEYVCRTPVEIGVERAVLRVLAP